MAVEGTGETFAQNNYGTREAEVLVPVSYTHLDVYKRQHIHVHK